MMVDLGEFEVLERQVTQACQRFLHIRAAGGDGFQQEFQFLVDREPLDLVIELYI